MNRRDFAHLKLCMGAGRAGSGAGRFYMACAPCIFGVQARRQQRRQVPAGMGILRHGWAGIFDVSWENRLLLALRKLSCILFAWQSTRRTLSS